MAGSTADLLPQELRILVAVAESGGFTAAATALGLTQSAVSHSVRGTEAKVGTVLFERGRGGATPTPAGDRAVALGRRILRMYEVLGAEARGAGRSGAGGGAGRDTVEGVLRIAAFRSAALHLLPPALERLAARHPGIRPEVRVVREIGAARPGKWRRAAPTWASPRWAGRTTRPRPADRGARAGGVPPGPPGRAPGPEGPAADGLGRELRLVHALLVAGPGLDPAGHGQGGGRRDGADHGRPRARHGDHARAVAEEATGAVDITDLGPGGR